MVLVSIIILTKNAGENIKALLEKIFVQNLAGTFEVIIIDSGSTDLTLKRLKGFNAKVYKINPEQFHHGKTRNLGASLARGEFLVYITQDALPTSNYWLQSLLDNFKDNSVVAVYGRQIPWSNASPPENFFYSYHFPNYKMVVEFKDKYLTGSKSNVFISDVNAAIRRNFWLKHKFSEKIAMAEDKDFARKIFFERYKIVYEPDACVFHSHNFTLFSLFKRFFDYGIALSQGIQELPSSKNNSEQRALNYFISEIKYLKENNFTRWIPYSISYEATKIIALSLGKNGKYLPRSFKNKFSESYSYFTKF